MASRVSERGQITIDRSARKELGIRPGMIAYQRVVSGCLEVFFLPATHRRSLCGVLHREGEPVKVRNAQELEEAVMEAIAEEQALAQVQAKAEENLAPLNVVRPISATH